MKVYVPHAWFDSQGNADLTNQTDCGGTQLLPTPFLLNTDQTDQEDFRGMRFVTAYLFNERE